MYAPLAGGVGGIRPAGLGERERVGEVVDIAPLEMLVGDHPHTLEHRAGCLVFVCGCVGVCLCWVGEWVGGLREFVSVCVCVLWVSE